MAEKTLAEQLRTKEGRVKWITDQATQFGYLGELMLTILYLTDDEHIIDRKEFLKKLLLRIIKLNPIQQSFLFLAVPVYAKQYCVAEDFSVIDEFAEALKKIVEAVSKDPTQLDELLAEPT